MEAYYPVDHLPLEFSLVSKICLVSPSRAVWDMEEWGTLTSTTCTDQYNLFFHIRATSNPANRYSPFQKNIYKFSIHLLNIFCLPLPNLVGWWNLCDGKIETL